MMYLYVTQVRTKTTLSDLWLNFSDINTLRFGTTSVTVSASYPFWMCFCSIFKTTRRSAANDHILHVISISAIFQMKWITALLNVTLMPSYKKSRVSAVQR